MKRFKGLIIVLAVTLLFSGCTKSAAENVIEKTRAVKVMELEETKNTVTLDYLGVVDSKELVKYSFKTPGKIQKILVKKGDEVKIGDSLAKLDPVDLDLQLKASRAQLDAAKLNISKATESYNYDKSNYANMEKLFEVDGLSQDNLNRLKLKLDVSEATMNQAKSQYEAASADFENKNNLIGESVIRAKAPGTVVEIPFEEFELVSQGYPIVVVRSNAQVINVGLSQKDVEIVNIGTEAIIDIDGKTATGTITNIAEAPDKATRTYMAEVLVEDEKYRLGNVAKVYFKIGDESGIWAPILSVMSDGQEFIYVVDGDRAFRKSVEITQTNDTHVMITGVEAGDKLVTSGMKKLSDGSKVTVEE